MIDNRIVLRPYQEECMEISEQKYKSGITRQLIVSATGCHAKGTLILMFNGTLKKVEEITINELLMGNDSTPRKVLNLYRGKELMYEIIPIKGEPFIVNKSHILSLKKTPTPGKYKTYPEIVNISIEKYLCRNKHFKHLYKLYKTGVEFSNSYRLPKLIDPYWLGLWLGDGSLSSPQITNEDPEIISYLNKMKLKPGYKMHQYHKGNKLYSFNITRRKSELKLFADNEYNVFLNDFRGLTKQKEFPQKYCTLPLNDRKKLLAGLIDSDGSISSNTYDFVNKSFTISNAVAFIARSLGLRATMVKCKKGIASTEFLGEYFRVTISGNISLIPCRIKRKIGTVNKQKKNPLVTGFSIKELETDDYYGFELDGNHLYCMGDFTVTHNTGKRLIAVETSKKFKSTLFIAHREELIEQAVNEFDLLYPGQVGIIKGPRFEIDNKIVVASAQTIYRRLEKISPEYFDLVIVDECFPEGTLIDGVDIKNVKVGDYINSYNHELNVIEKQKVTHKFKNEIKDDLLKVSLDNGIEIICTKNHPFYTKEFGYIPAKDISLCHVMMSCGNKENNLLLQLPKRIRGNSISKNSYKKIRENLLFFRMSKESIYKNSKNNLQLLQNRTNCYQQKQILENVSSRRLCLLFGRTQKAILSRNGIQNNISNEQDLCFGKNEKKQSNVQSENKRKNDFISTRSYISSKRRKWSTYFSTIDNPSIDSTSNRICNRNKITGFFAKISSLFIQGRFSMSRSKIINRNRWSDTQTKKMDVFRQKKNRSFEFVRVESVEIYKSRSRQKSKQSSTKNYVYNLEIEKNNNYFANSILVHNCHHFVSKTFIQPLHYFKPKLMQGYTATPTRLDGLNFSNIFDEIIFTYDIAQAIEEKYLCELDAIRVKTQVDLSSIHRVAGDFNQKELSMTVDNPERNALVVQKYLQYSKDRQAIVFGVDIEHSKHLAEAFESYGISAKSIHSELDMDTRRKINSDFKNKRLMVMTNVNLLTEGWDYFDVGAILMARPTESLAMYMQMIGRGTRLKSLEFIENEFNISIKDDAIDAWIDLDSLTYKNKGYTFFKHFSFPGLAQDERDFILKYYHKANCKILDFVDLSGKHKLVNTWELDKQKDPKNKVFITEEKRDKMLSEEKQRRESRIKNVIRQDSKIDLFTLPEVTIHHTGRMLDLATEPQLKWLKDEGVWQEGVEYTKGQASEFISNFPAKDWQLRYLAEWGYDISNGATVGHYSKVKQERQQNAEGGTYSPVRLA
jgi:superfamily II DNA or RNA helicase